MNTTKTKRLHSRLLTLAVAATAASLAPAARADEPAGLDSDNGLGVTKPDRELMIHGFRAPSMGVEVRDGWLGFHVGVYPTILSAQPDQTVWFAKTGVSFYFLSFETWLERESGFYASVSLIQGLSGRFDVSEDVSSGSGVTSELGFRWAIWAGLDLRLGVSVLNTFDGQWFVNPTPGLSWSIALP